MTRSLGLIGAGWVVQNCYLPAFADAGCTVVAVTDANPLATKRLVDRLGGVACRGVEELLGHQVDLVVVATPPYTHAALSRQALAAGHEVLCEKPLALCTDDIADLLSPGGPRSGEPATDGPRLRVSSPFRFRPDVRALVDLARSGVLGHIYSARSTWLRARGIPRPGSWYTNRHQAGGGVLADLGPHVIDLSLLVLDKPAVTEVEAWTATTLASSGAHASSWMRPTGGTGEQVIDVEDQAAVRVRFADQSQLEVRLSWAGYRDHDLTRFELEGTSGRAVLETLLGYSTMAPPTPPTLRTWTARGTHTRSFDFARDPRIDFGHMLRACWCADDIGPASGTECLRVVDIIERAYSGSKRGSERFSPSSGA